jgi:hypothetical protein
MHKMADIVAARHAALRLTRFEALEGFLLLVRHKDRLAAEFDTVRLRVSPTARGAFENVATFELRGNAEPGFAVPGQTRGICEPWQWLAQDGFGACIYAGAGVAATSVTARSCLGIGIPSFFSRSANSPAIFVR